MSTAEVMGVAAAGGVWPPPPHVPPPSARVELAGPVVAATAPPEASGRARDDVRMLVSVGDVQVHGRFVDLPDYLVPGDVLVVNDSATLPASLPAEGDIGAFRLNLSTRIAPSLYLAEPRYAFERPGPLPLRRGASFTAGGESARLVEPYPGAERLWYVAIDGERAMRRAGTPIRYGYVRHPQPLGAYQTVFARTPGSAEMPSAGRPFSRRVLHALRGAGVEIATVTLHTGVSSLEPGDLVGSPPPEPFVVGAAAAAAIARARARKRRVIAVGTTVVRALEAAFDGSAVRAARGATRLLVGPDRPVRAVDGLLTGLHEPQSTHLDLLIGLAGAGRIQASYRALGDRAYRWHEFGDVHLILP